MKPILILVFTVFLFFGCTSHKSKQLSGNIEITDGWVRPGKAGMMSAAYFKLKNATNAADTLLSVSSDVSSTTQIHQSYQTDDGLMGMQEQEFVPLPIGEQVTFKQGGLHIMIIQPERDLAEGDSIEFRLKFSSSEDIRIKFPVKLGVN